MVVLMPHLGGVLILDENKSCFVPTILGDKHKKHKLRWYQLFSWERA